MPLFLNSEHRAINSSFPFLSLQRTFESYFFFLPQNVHGPLSLFRRDIVQLFCGN